MEPSGRCIQTHGGLRVATRTVCRTTLAAPSYRRGELVPDLSDGRYRVVLLLSLVSLGAGAKPSPEYRAGICVRELDWTDLTSARAAADQLFAEIARKQRFTYSTRFMARSQEVVRLLENGQANVGWLMMSDFVQLEKKHRLRLLARPLVAGGRFRLELIVPAGSSVRKLSQLRGRTISIHKQIEINQVYLETLVAREGLGPAAGFFSEIKRREKAKSAVVDVLMGEVDACLVPAAVRRALPTGDTIGRASVGPTPAASAAPTA